MEKTVHYLFDPLCGWCYGTTPLVSELLALPGINLKLLPTGLFSGNGARPMDDAFATYAWSNDQRIERLTGQRFSDQYHQRVLGDRQQMFDSGPATLALAATSLTDPAREFDVLKAIQRARYVDGEDVTSLMALGSLLESLGLKEAATRLTHSDAELFSANQTRLGHAQDLMREVGASGVPTLTAESGTRRWVLNHAIAYSNPRALLNQLETA